MGMVIVPEFYQPAYSKNLTFETQALFQCVNVGEILSGVSGKSRNDLVQASILGDVVAEVRLVHVHLPKVKVSAPLFFVHACMYILSPASSMVSLCIQV